MSGDLLAKSRADSLYSLETWQDGTYEKGSLVNYKGSLWRANTAVLAGAGAPGFAGTAEIPSVPAGPGGVPALVPAVPAVPAAPWTKVPLTAGVHNVALDTNLPTTAAPTEVYLVLNSAKAGGKPGLFSYDSGTAKWVLLGGNEGGSKSMPLTGGQAMMAVGCPIGAIMMWPTDTSQGAGCCVMARRLAQRFTQSWRHCSRMARYRLPWCLPTWRWTEQQRHLGRCQPHCPGLAGKRHRTPIHSLYRHHQQQR